MYIAQSEGNVLGCFRLGRADSDAISGWNLAGLPVDDGKTLYLSRIAVSPEKHGAKDGSLLLDAAMGIAKTLDGRRVRLDCWAGNWTLRAFYSAGGFTHISDVEAPTKDRAGEVIRVSLFERPV